MAAQPTILVTGGTGFIGRHLVRRLVDAGGGVRLFCRSARKAEGLFGSGIDVVEGDLTSADAVSAACRGMRHVFHLGGFYQFGARHRVELWQTNVVGTRNVMTACRTARVERVIHCSTAGVLAADGRLVTHRDFPSHPPAGCGYKVSKWHAEQETLEAATRGLPVIIASPTAPIGPGDDRPTPTGRMVLDLMRGRFPCCSKTGLNVVAVEDVADGLVAVGERGVPGERYLLGHANLWLEEFLGLVAAQAKVPAPRALAPWPLVALGGLLGDAFGLLMRVGGERLCWETAYFAKQAQFFDFAHSRDALGWRAAKSIDEAIGDALAWFAARRELQVPETAVAPTRSVVS